MGTEEKLRQMGKKKSDLSDIILEKERGSGEKIKKLLLGGASLVLLFLIVLIIVKMLNNPEEAVVQENLASAAQPASPAPAPHSTAPAATSDTHEAGEDGLFKQEPIIDEGSDTDLKFEEMVKKLKEQDKSLQATGETPKEEKIDLAPTASASAQKPATPPHSEERPAPKQETATPKKAASAPAIVPAPAPVKPHVVHTPAPTPVKSTSLPGYFIQVGATTRSFPDRRFLKKIKASGYDYIIQKVTLHGRTVKKVLVGPYGTKAAALKALPGVRTTINPSAFLFRVK